MTRREPVPPRPAASALLVRPGQRSLLEIFMIRRQTSMRFLGGYYAFPGGAVDPADRTSAAFARCTPTAGTSSTASSTASERRRTCAHPLFRPRARV